jgi:nucleoside phosphorylase
LKCEGAVSLIYVFAASDMEAEPVRKAATSGGVNEIVLFTGAMGPKNARSKAEGAFASSVAKPAAVLIAGLCGGLTEDLNEGDIVLYDACLSAVEGGRKLSCDVPLTRSIESVLKSASIPYQQASGVMSSRIATNRVERSTLATSGARVVDMESFAIMDVAASVGVPAAVLRVVSDSVDRSLPDLNSALSEGGGLDGRKALGVALRSPIATVRLLAANRRAMRHLSGAIHSVLKAPLLT